MFEEEKWEKLLEDIEKHRGKKKVKKISKTLVSIAIFLVILNSFGIFQNQIIALRTTILEIISQDESQVQYGWLPTEINEKFEIDNIILPDYLPPGYELEDLNVIDKTFENYQATLIFTDENNKIRLIQEKVGEGTQISANFGKAKVKTTEINGEKGIIAFHDNGYITITFIDSRGIEHVITGAITEEELIRLAESLN